jgi:hypothetical protein
MALMQFMGLIRCGHLAAWLSKCKPDCLAFWHMHYY